MLPIILPSKYGTHADYKVKPTNNVNVIYK